MFPIDHHTSLWFVPSAEPLLMDLIETATGGVDLLDRASLPDSRDAAESRGSPIELTPTLNDQDGDGSSGR
jgi:hypothetical protein